jgi:hypothetical protein
MSKHWLLPGLLLFAFPVIFSGVGCNALNDFRTKPGEVYYGQVIGSDSAEDAPSFIRSGFASRTTMELTFDPQLAARQLDAGEGGGGRGRDADAVPGTLHTFQCPADDALCKKADRRPGDFNHAPLESIARLTNDPLSHYDFPGGGRLRNYIFGARFSTSIGTRKLLRYAMVFLSLMENGKVEVRVIAPSVLDDDGQTELTPELFGVFALERRKT